MAAGENTLNALCARLVTRTIADSKGAYDPEAFLRNYVAFMYVALAHVPPRHHYDTIRTTPGTHNDTYAESFHRDFFSNWARGIPPAQCAKGTEGHNTASIGGFVMLPPVTLSLAGPRGDWPSASCATRRHLALTHDSTSLARYADVYAQLLYDVARGGDLRSGAKAAAASLGVDVERLAGLDDRAVVQRFGSACYITSSLPVVLYLAYKHAGSFEEAVLANVNAGGENAHRGAALGALMGAAVGKSVRGGLMWVLGVHKLYRAYLCGLSTGCTIPRQLTRRSTRM